MQDNLCFDVSLVLFLKYLFKLYTENIVMEMEKCVYTPWVIIELLPSCIKMDKLLAQVLYFKYFLSNQEYIFANVKHTLQAILQTWHIE